MSAGRRIAVLALLLCAAVVLQASVFRHVSVEGVVPNLALMVVVATALARGSEAGALCGFAGGLLLDVAPPADHVAGRWALALVIVGYLAGRVREDARDSLLATVLVVGAASFAGTSIYALTGPLVGDGGLAADQMIRVIVIGVLWDLALAPLVMPALAWLLEGPGRDLIRRGGRQWQQS